MGAYTGCVGYSQPKCASIQRTLVPPMVKMDNNLSYAYIRDRAYDNMGNPQGRR
jgi:hypothetical protein